MKCRQNKAFLKVAVFSFFEMRPSARDAALYFRFTSEDLSRSMAVRAESRTTF